MSRSRAVTPRPPTFGRRRRSRRLHDERAAGDHQHDLVRGPRHGLVDETERVAEAPAERRLGVDSPADLVRHEDQGGARARRRRRPARPPRPRDRQSESSGLLSSRFATQRFRQSTTTTSASPSSAVSADASATRNLDGAPAGGRSARWRAIRAAISSSPASAVATNTTRPPMRPGASDGERALPGADAAQDQEGPGLTARLGRGLRLGEIACGNPGLPSKTGSERSGPRQVS